MCIGVTPECRQTELEMIGDGRGHADEAYHDSQDATGCSTGTVTVVTVPQHGHNTIGYPLPEKAVAMKKWVGFLRNLTYSSDLETHPHTS